ncbi:MAG: 5-formyltetrahydrofolate cyclo-ligase [Desulfurococcaceae archaeon]
MSNINKDVETIKKIKAEIRKTIWELMETRNIAMFPRPVYGRIPNFVGADKAALKITSIREWEKAIVIKSNPDSPQIYLREKALENGKILIMATPRLSNGFLILDPRKIPRNKIKTAATITGSFKFGKIIKLDEIPPIDLIVTGCVAVDKKGVRLGKGGGYAELEYGILRELNLIDERTPVVTTIHDLQVINSIPLEIHDLSVDYYATPTKLVKIEPQGYKPKGIYWDLLREKRHLQVIMELEKILRTKNK